MSNKHDLQTLNNPQGESLRSARRLVIKVGAAVLVDATSGSVNRLWLEAFADDIAALRARGQEVVIVTSGAIAAGRRQLGLVGKNLNLEEKQAAAATGQISLAHAWQESLARHALTVAQILLTPDAQAETQQHLNARATINTLLRLGAVPLVNENDTVAVEEIRDGDNDCLAAQVAQMVSADTLVMLSSMNGLYTADPRLDARAKLIERVTEITPSIEIMSNPQIGGGMATKVQAAKIALQAGCRMAIAYGRVLRPLMAMEESACTWFVPTLTPVAARKQWLAAHHVLSGALQIDPKDVAVLQRGKSLLPAQVLAVEGVFKRGDMVNITTLDGQIIGRGLAAYNHQDAARIKGRQAAELDLLLGYQGGRDVLIHRDDLVLIG